MKYFFLLSILSFSAFAQGLHFTDVGSLNIELPIQHPLVEELNKYVKKEYGNTLEPAKSIKVSGLYSNNESELKKMNIRYSLYSKKNAGYLFCESDVLVEKIGGYSITSESCEM